MARSSELRKNPRIPTKVLVSILFGAVGFLAAQFVDRGDRGNVAMELAVSLFVGGIAFVVQFLYDVEKRLEAMELAYNDHADVTNERITEGFRKISAATELFSLVEASALKTDAMTQLVRNSTRIEATPPLVFDFAQAEIARLSEMLRTISEGADVTYEGEDRDWMLGLTHATNASIDATSLTTVDAGGRGFVDGGLWASDLGQRYLDAQKDAIKRSVRIRRIFIMDRPELQTDPDFLSVCRYHQEIGIDVKILDPSKIPGTRRGSLFDFIIFDGVLSYQTTPASRVSGDDRSRPIIINTQLVTRSDAVLNRTQRFQELWRTAQEVP